MNDATETIDLCQRCGVVPARRRSLLCHGCDKGRAAPTPGRALRTSERPAGGGGRAYGTSTGPVYARDVPGQWWSSAMAAGRALECQRSSVVLALATGRPCRGVRLTADPPPWRLAELAAAERRRERGLVVRPWWAAVGPGPAARNCEQRVADKERRMA